MLHAIDAPPMVTVAPASPEMVVAARVIQRHPAEIRVEEILADVQRAPDFGEGHRRELIRLLIDPSVPESAKIIIAKAFRIIDPIEARRREMKRVAHGS